MFNMSIIDDPVDDNVDDYLYLKESENGNLKFDVDACQLDLRCTTFHNFLWMRKKKKLAGLWLAGEVVNHVGIYGSKAAEGLSAFQRRSCSQCHWIKPIHNYKKNWCNMHEISLDPYENDVSFKIQGEIIRF